MGRINKAAKEFIEACGEACLTPLKSEEFCRSRPCGAKIPEKLNRLNNGNIDLDPASTLRWPPSPSLTAYGAAPWSTSPRRCAQPLYDFKPPTDASPTPHAGK